MHGLEGAGEGAVLEASEEVIELTGSALQQPLLLLNRLSNLTKALLEIKRRHRQFHPRQVPSRNPGPCGSRCHLGNLIPDFVRIEARTKPASVRPLIAWSNHADVYNRNGLTRIARKNARAPERIWHAGNQDISGLQKCTTEHERLFISKVAIRLIEVRPITYISQLNQPNVTPRVLVFRLDPVSIRKHIRFRQCIAQGHPFPTS